MSAWWADDHPRLEAERAAIKALTEKTDWLHDVEWSFGNDFNMQVVFEVRLVHRIFPLRLIYHNTFPSTCPSIQSYDGTYVSSHQYGSSDLCLEIRPDNWLPEFTGARMIQSAHDLLHIERPDENGIVKAAPSAHNVPQTIESRSASFRLYLSSNEFLMLNNNETPKLFYGQLWQQWGMSHLISYLAEASHDDWSWKNDSLSSALGKEASVRPCMILKSTKTVQTFDAVTTKDELLSTLETSVDLDESTFCCLICPTEGLPILFQKLENREELIRHRTILAPNETESRNGDIQERLAETRIGIVGLGSLGSKIAVSLARAGVKRFDLIDDDILHAGNLERHDADWRDIGLHKVDSTSRRIKLVSGSAQVTARRVSIGAQVSTTEMAAVDGALNGCDVIIDASANPEVLNHLSAISSLSGNSVIWGGIYAGGIGGYMARSRLEHEPSPHLIRQALNEHYEGIEEKPPVVANQRYGGLISDEVFVASDPEVSLMAAHLSNFSLDTLLKNEPSQFDMPLYLLGFKRAWVFESAFHVQPIAVDAPIRKRKDPNLKSEDQENFVGELVKKKLDEIANQSENT